MTLLGHSHFTGISQVLNKGTTKPRFKTKSASQNTQLNRRVVKTAATTTKLEVERYSVTV